MSVLKLQAAPPQEPRQSRDEDLRRAARHHRRAIRALEGAASEELSPTLTDRLLRRLRSDLYRLEARLRARAGN